MIHDTPIKFAIVAAGTFNFALNFSISYTKKGLIVVLEYICFFCSFGSECAVSELKRMENFLNTNETETHSNLAQPTSRKPLFLRKKRHSLHNYLQSSS